MGLEVFDVPHKVPHKDNDARGAQRDRADAAAESEGEEGGEEGEGGEMTDTQLLTLGLAIVVPVSFLIYAVLEVKSEIRRSAEQLSQAIRREHHT